MLNYTDEQKALIRSQSVHKGVTIHFLDADYEDITNDKIYTESLELHESICEEENLKFGSCNSSTFTIQVADNTDDLKGHEIQVTMTFDNGIDTPVSVPLGIFYIDSVETATDKRYKKLTCYDRMYYFQKDVIDFYNTLFPSVSTEVTLKHFRDTFFTYMNIEQNVIALPNDNMMVSKTIDADTLSGLDVIRAICEINGVFGHIDRYGRFTYIRLDNDILYPDESLYPDNELYPRGSLSDNDQELIPLANYIPPNTRETYSVTPINRLQIRNQEGDIGAVVTSSEFSEDNKNTYVITDNFLVYGLNATDLQTVATNVSSYIFGITYVPNETNTVGLPYLEVGDLFFIYSLSEPFSSFVLSRTLTGIQGLRETWVSQGEQYLPEIETGTNSQITQIKQRTNVLRRTVEENYAEITERLSTDEGLIEENSSSIQQLPGQILTTVSQTYLSQSDASTTYSTKTELSQTATSINSTVATKVGNNEVISKINQSAESITINASKLNLTGYITATDVGASGSTIINGSRLYGGQITLGGNGNGNGSLRVNNSSGTQIVALNNNGITINKGSISITQNDTQNFISLYGTSSSSNYLTLSPSQIVLNESNHYITTIGREEVTNVNRGTGAYASLSAGSLVIGNTNGALCNFNFNVQANNRLVINCNSGIYIDEFRGLVQNVGYVRLGDLLANLYITYPNLFSGIIE